jgi:hypothetical protein
MKDGARSESINHHEGPEQSGPSLYLKGKIMETFKLSPAVFCTIHNWANDGRSCDYRVSFFDTATRKEKTGTIEIFTSSGNKSGHLEFSDYECRLFDTMRRRHQQKRYFAFCRERGMTMKELKAS